MASFDDMFGNDSDSDSDSQEPTGKRPSSSGVMAFHNGTEEALLTHVTRFAKQGDCLGILKAIDCFCYTRHWMMHIGDEKGKILLTAIEMAKQNSASYHGSSSDSPQPMIAVELGSYCGYSAVMIGMQLSAEMGDRLYCIENNAQCVGYTQRMVNFAGLSDRVIVLCQAASEIETWSSAAGLAHGGPFIAFLLIDHEKSRYLPDLRAIETSGFLQSGAVVVADNVLSFGSPLDDYLQHVREGAVTSPAPNTQGRVSPTTGNDPNRKEYTNLSSSNSSNYRSSTLFKASIEYAQTGKFQNSSPTKSESADGVDFLDGVEISVYR